MSFSGVCRYFFNSFFFVCVLLKNYNTITDIEISNGTSDSDEMGVTYEVDFPDSVNTAVCEMSSLPEVGILENLDMHEVALRRMSAMNFDSMEKKESSQANLLSLMVIGKVRM